jgi:uncharacterized caspase-like protein
MSFTRCRDFISLMFLGLLAAASLGGPALGAEPGKRLALVVGNSAYQNVTPLTNPANDATDIAAKLKNLQFDVLLATNADHDKLVTMLEEFKNRVTREHVALFFFAGHGVTVNSESFLIPVDSPAEIDLDDKGDPRADSVQKHLVSMASVLAPLEASKIGIVFLDACRTNAAQPDLNLRVVSLKANRAVPILRGAGSMEIKPSPYSAGVFRAYATQLDNVASDGAGRNSPFTKALLTHIATKGISIQELMIRVRKSVMQETENKQVPWEEAALNEIFYFVTPVAGAPSTTSPGAKPAGNQAASPPRPAPRPNLPPNLGVGIGGGL